MPVKNDDLGKILEIFQNFAKTLLTTRIPHGKIQQSGQQDCADRITKVFKVRLGIADESLCFWLFPTVAGGGNESGRYSFHRALAIVRLRWYNQTIVLLSLRMLLWLK